MLLTQTRRFVTAALVKIVSICRSASPESPLAWRSRTLVWRKCLSLSDCIKSVFLKSARASIARSLAIGAAGGLDRAPQAACLATGCQVLSLRALSHAKVEWGWTAKLLNRLRGRSRRREPVGGSDTFERWTGHLLSVARKGDAASRCGADSSLPTGTRESGVKRQILGSGEQDAPRSAVYRRPPAAPAQKQPLGRREKYDRTIKLASPNRPRSEQPPSGGTYLSRRRVGGASMRSGAPAR